MVGSAVLGTREEGAAVRPLRPCEQARLRLVLFPSAGAGVTRTFRPWLRLVAGDVELVGVELPGHGARVLEKPLDRLDDMRELVAGDLDHLAPLPTVFVGHSFGALLAYAVALAAGSQHGPVGLVACNAVSPTEVARAAQSGRDRLDTRLEDRVTSRFTMPPSLDRHPELAELFRRTLRADLAAYASFSPAGPCRLDVPTVVVGSADDELIPANALAPWSTAIAGPLAMFDIAGGHFALHDRSTAATILELAEGHLGIRLQEAECSR